ncbi:MAG: hypothetical protein JW388_0253 [Nitrospira sp.]|nr:hypothetical protein [Nitrospira sp.]
MPNSNGGIGDQYTAPRQDWNVQRIEAYTVARQNAQASLILHQCLLIDLRAADEQRVVMSKAGGRNEGTVGRQLFPLQSRIGEELERRRSKQGTASRIEQIGGESNGSNR